VIKEGDETREERKGHVDASYNGRKGWKGGKKRRKEGRKEGIKEVIKEGTKEGTKEGNKGGRKEERDLDGDAHIFREKVADGSAITGAKFIHVSGRGNGRWRVASPPAVHPLAAVVGMMQRMDGTTDGCYNGWMLQRRNVTTDGCYNGGMLQRMELQRSDVTREGCYNGCI
jgi:hypothetical protein